MAEPECVEFNGKKYRRYPDSHRKHLQRYFTRSRSFLHRDIWVHFNGPIPAGHQIHHLDGNHLNNDISNLGCLSKEEHCAEHSEARSAFGRSEKQQAHLAEIREKAAEWHRSPEGVAWHAEHGRLAWIGRKKVSLVCEQCSGPFESFVSTARFCSRSCQNKRWYKEHPDYDAAKRAKRKAARLQHRG